MRAATTTKMAVQAPWTESALNPIEIPSIADADKNVKSIDIDQHESLLAIQIRPQLTEDETAPEEFSSKSTTHDRSGIIDTVHLWMQQLELSDHVSTPRRHGSNHDQDDGTGNHSECVERRRNSKNTESDLCLAHQDNSTHPSDL